MKRLIAGLFFGLAAVAAADTEIYDENRLLIPTVFPTEADCRHHARDVADAASKAYQMKLTSECFFSEAVVFGTGYRAAIRKQSIEDFPFRLVVLQQYYEMVTETRTRTVEKMTSKNQIIAHEQSYSVTTPVFHPIFTLRACQEFCKDLGAGKIPGYTEGGVLDAGKIAARTCVLGEMADLIEGQRETFAPRVTYLIKSDAR